jgi:uncharacterized membrane protein
MKQAVISYLACLAVLGALDAVWLMSMQATLYQPTIGSLMADKPNWAAIVAFYLLYIAGILYFAVMPALASGNWSEALIKGALFGFFCYATYDLTNMATLKVWALKLTLADMGWGTFLTGSSATASFFITRLIVR